MQLPIKKWDERWQLLITPKPLQAAADHFMQCCTKAMQEHGSFSVALSGGSTPKALYQLLTKPPYSNQIPWEKLWLFWSDERSVPPTHPDNNYHMAMEAGLKNMPIAHIYRMHAETNIEQNAALYEEAIKHKPFDLVMLGIGEDGHTASLFPDTEALRIKDRLVAANYIPDKKTWRMTLTYSGIHHSKNIVIYVLGESKKQIVHDVFLGPKNRYPIQKIGTKEHPALWILDKAAASFLS